MTTVQVLCPNGRRQNVKVTPNTKLLQVLEEVCKKQGFLPPEDYSLKHGRKTVDITLSVRYANLANNAKLELIKSEKSRTEQDVLIALQLEDGQRLQHPFPPSTSLWDILCHWQNTDSSHKDLCKVDATHVPPIQPTCIYMREEVIGEMAMKETSLRKLGLTDGKAVIRLVHRPVDDMVMAEILDKLEKEKMKMERLDKIAQRQASQNENEISKLTASATENLDKTESSQTGANDTQVKSESSSVSRSLEEMEVDSNVKSGQGSQTEQSVSSHENSAPSTSSQPAPMDVEEKIETAGYQAMASEQQQSGQQQQGNLQQRQQEFVDSIRQMNIPGVQVFAPGDFNDLSPQEQEIARRLAAHYMPQLGIQVSQQQPTASKPKKSRAPNNAPFADFKFPEETKGKDVYKNELSDVNREEYKPCDRQAMVFNSEEVTSTTSSEDLPDDFFEVTDRDIRKMMVDLQNTVRNYDEQPLLTKTMIQERLEAKYSKYKHVVIRIMFPDKLVLQGLFRLRETVFAIHKFVKEHLEDKSEKFYLYTSPPKKVLKDQTQTMIQANLAPATLMYFGSETPKEHYLSEAVLKEITSKSKAESVVESCLPTEPETLPKESVPSTSKPRQAREAVTEPAKSSTGKEEDKKKPGVPKWFTVGKK